MRHYIQQPVPVGTIKERASGTWQKTDTGWKMIKWKNNYKKKEISLKEENKRIDEYYMPKLKKVSLIGLNRVRIAILQSAFEEYKNGNMDFDAEWCEELLNGFMYYCKKYN